MSSLTLTRRVMAPAVLPFSPALNSTRKLGLVVMVRNVSASGSVGAGMSASSMMAPLGYDLHITRRTEWTDPESDPPIARDEFERVVLGDARFRRDERLGPDLAVLMKTARDTDYAPWLCWQDGEIRT